MDHPVVEAIRAMHPQIAGKLTPTQWTQIITLVETVVTQVVNIFGGASK